MGKYEGGYIGARPSWDSANRTGLWTPESVYQRQSNRLWIKSNDPFINNVVAYLKFDEANGSNTFIDDGALNLPVTNLGTTGVTVTTTQKKYGTGSGSFPSTQGYLSLNHPSLALGTSPYTIEFWLYKSTGTNNGILTFGASNTDASTYIVHVYNNILYLFSGGTTFTIPLNSWFHLAIVREGTGSNQTKIYVNGALIFQTNNANNYTQTFYNIGVYYSSSYCWNGLIDSFRVTKGVTRYTSNFNPETDTYLAY